MIVYLLAMMLAYTALAYVFLNLWFIFVRLLLSGIGYFAP